MTRPILVTGATGKQGGSVVNALLERPDDFTILAVTRDPNSASAQRLAAKSSTIKLVKGDLNDVPTLFEAAQAASPTGKIWGVFSVQGMEMKVKHDTGDLAAAPEVKQGVGLIDAALKAGVSHFVYTSVDRGGEERSWSNPTPVPHFKTKHYIEQHLRKAAEGSSMTWTIARPPIFMDNLEPGFMGNVMLTAVRDTLKNKRMPWVATKDIGRFAAAAFRDPAALNHRAITVAGDDVNFADIDAKFKSVTGKSAPTTYSFIASGLQWGVAELGTMFQWFRDDGYRADLPELRKFVPVLTDFETWLKEDSKYPKAA
ncbi:hypothetical protein VHUM_02538 [Vanrija humicola]|uniref:NmrA-like domain-containing protein n=1 Tax=Vanrija humicola TaxID=5417 RepID=A0A7D8Z2Z1_VANHU|nr:hypothetical protein VHUM_02538 [Vanrija humicola]